MPGDALLDLDTIRIDASWALRVPESLALRRRVLLFGEADGAVYAACADPDDHAAVEALERIAGTRVIAIRAEPQSLQRVLARVFHRRAESAGDDAVRAVDDLLHAALLEQASDIHLEPSRDGVRVRYRIDGVLETRRELSNELAPSVLNRIKVLASLDIAEKRLPQDGRFSHVTGPDENARPVDIRVAVLPTRFGERMTLRLLALGSERLTLPRLGMPATDLTLFRRAIEAPHGLVLLTGPTGSGKTTTLYAALREIDAETQNIITIEEPVELGIAGASQVEVDSDDRVSFSSALRSVLRHDPDVLMIGEIRDIETASTAVKAALTGHLVFSTLHTNNSVGAVTRLIDLGVPAYLVGATLRLSVAQRLVRRLCARCCAPRPLASAEAIALAIPEAEGQHVFERRGCVYCRRSGFAGRTGIFESFAPDAEMQAQIAAGAREDRLAAAARAHGAATLRRDAAEKVLAGVTTVAEALAALEIA